MSKASAYQALRVAHHAHPMHASRPDRVLHAPDAEQAIKEAIARYGISNPQEQARLPQRVKEIG
jgi:hypothetical protein